ncbi:MAG: hypothetical protein WCP97_01640 [bacterium]
MRKTLFIATAALTILLSGSAHAVVSQPAFPDNSKQPQNFWASGYQAKWINQTSAHTDDEYFDVHPGDQLFVEATFQNTGDVEWFGSVSNPCISIYKDPRVTSSWTGKDTYGSNNYGTSEFQDPLWNSQYNLDCKTEGDAQKGGFMQFILVFSIPENAPTGSFREDITMSAGNYWVASVPETADPIGAAHIWVGLHITPRAAAEKPRLIVPMEANQDISKLISLEYDKSTWLLNKYGTLENTRIPECVVNTTFSNFGYYGLPTRETAARPVTLSTKKALYKELYYNYPELMLAYTFPELNNEAISLSIATNENDRSCITQAEDVIRSVSF